MRKAVLVTLLRLALVVALFASAALFIEYQRAGDPAFCGVGSGCMAVRLSPYSKLFGVPLPTWGLLAFGSLFAFVMAARSRAQHLAVAIAAAFGAVVAAVLVYLQAAEIHAFCKWCVMADSSAFVAAIVATALYRHVNQGATTSAAPTANETGVADLVGDPPVTIAWIVAVLVAFCAPFVWAQYPVIPPLPKEIADLQVPGKVTLVSFTDFECPFCRALHPTLEELVSKHAGQIVIVRKMMPLSGHPGALPAALAYECASLDRREKMVDALYGAPEELLNREGLLSLAEANVGIDRAALGRCIDAPETRKLVDADRDLFTAIQGAALPLTYVNDRAILGFKADQVRDAVTLALQGPRPSLPLSALFAVVGVVLVGASGITLRSGKKSR
ncbi:MAG: vitamin K epoxide reductase family protein [Byssovorax sp.]